MNSEETFFEILKKIFLRFFKKSTVKNLGSSNKLLKNATNQSKANILRDLEQVLYPVASNIIIRYH